MSPIIDIRDVTIRFGAVTAVNQVSFQVFPGEVFGLLGPNGSGKTTLIRALCGLLRFSAGSATVFDRDVATHADEIRERVGLSQSRFATLLGVSVRTLQDWEQGRRAPSGAARTLLLVAHRNPRVLLDVA